MKIAYFGLVLFLLESSSGLESFNLLTETLFNFVFVIFLFLLGSRESKKLVLCASGLALGLALFVRPVGQILLIPLLLILAFKARRKQIALVLLIAVAVSSTWIIRNQIVFGVPQLSGIQSLNLLQYEGAGAFAKENDVSLEEAQTTEIQLEMNDVGQNSSIRSIVEYRVDRGIELIVTNPVGFVELHVEGAAKILLGPGSANISKLTAHLGISEIVKDLLKVVIVLMRLLVTFLVLFSIYIALRTRIFLPIQFYSIVSWILILISSGGANAYSRFRVPLIPLEIIIICIGLSNPIQRAWLEKHYMKVKRLIWT
jgi:4-amino-4-deoxy-L-arabinose transferase-like glycosyltransferase